MFKFFKKKKPIFELGKVVKDKYIPLKRFTNEMKAYKYFSDVYILEYGVLFYLKDLRNDKIILKKNIDIDNLFKHCP